MPKPKKDETRSEYLKRCPSIVMNEGTTKDPKQAYAICVSMWDEHKKEGKQMKKKSFTTFTKQIEQNNDIFTFVASKETVDREGDIIDIEGIDTTNFEKSKSMFFNHRWSGARDVPIAKAVGIRKDLSSNPRVMKLDVEFAPTEFAQEVKMLVEKKFINGLSVTVLPNYDTIELQGNTRFVKNSELIEASIVNVPMHPDALREKGVSEDSIKILQKNCFFEEKNINNSEMKELKARIEKLEKQLEDKEEPSLYDEIFSVFDLESGDQASDDDQMVNPDDDNDSNELSIDDLL